MTFADSSKQASVRVKVWPAPIFLLVCACSGAASPPEGAPSEDSGAAADAGPTDRGSVEDAGSLDALAFDGSSRDAATSDRGPVDPFAPQPDESEGLTNVATDLRALLENGALVDACAEYEADSSDRRKMLLCGKSMFFYESFGTVGVPEIFIHFFGANFPEVGHGWSEYGMVQDPYAARDRPLGFGEAPPLGTAETLAFTCASCHFAQLPDGRFAVGAPNHRYEYGKMITTIMVVPSMLTPSADPADHDPAAIAFVQPMLDRLEMDRSLRLRLLLDLLPLLGSSQMTTPVSKELEAHYARWLSGTQDFVIPPLPIDDGVLTVSKIIALWGLPRADEQANAGMPHALLAWTGGAQSLERFLEGFAILGTGDLATWTPDRLRPLAEYIYSLRAPPSLSPPPAAEVARGRGLFEDRGCLACHGGPRGSGVDLFDYEQIGTDAEMKRWVDPELDGVPCCGIAQDGVTHQLKSPRLTGLHSFGRFLHNGSVPTLEALLCIDGPRGDVIDPAYGNGGHTYGCDLPSDERQALIAFMRSL